MKRGNNAPRRKRLKRHARLVQAKTWFSSYTGKSPVKGYAKWFGVDWLCALTELKLSGISFAPESEQKIISSYNQRIEFKRKQKQLSDLKLKESELWESDENFAIIIGRTSNGVPFGVTHEEWEDEKHFTEE